MTMVRVIDHKKSQHTVDVAEHLAAKALGCVPCKGHGRFTKTTYYDPWFQSPIYWMGYNYNCHYCNGFGYFTNEDEK